VKRALLLALVLAAVAGCGGGPEGKPLTKAELIRRGDAVCAKARQKGRELRRKAPARSPVDPMASDETVRRAAPVLQQLSDNVRDARSGLAALKPPRQIEKRWSQMLDDLDAVAGKLHDTAEAAAGVDRQGVVDRYSEALRLNRKVSRFETSYGFQVCGS
jgi:hypothetical protein